MASHSTAIDFSGPQEIEGQTDNPSQQSLVQEIALQSHADVHRTTVVSASLAGPPRVPDLRAAQAEKPERIRKVEGEWGNNFMCWAYPPVN